MGRSSHWRGYSISRSQYMSLYMRLYRALIMDNCAWYRPAPNDAQPHVAPALLRRGHAIQNEHGELQITPQGIWFWALSVESLGMYRVNKEMRHLKHFAAIGEKQMSQVEIDDATGEIMDALEQAVNTAASEAANALADFQRMEGRIQDAQAALDAKIAEMFADELQQIQQLETQLAMHKAAVDTTEQALRKAALDYYKDRPHEGKGVGPNRVVVVRTSSITTYDDTDAIDFCIETGATDALSLKKAAFNKLIKGGSVPHELYTNEEKQTTAIRYERLLELAHGPQADA